jgi:hypothetical protein
MISAKVELTQPLAQQRQFVARTGSEHYFLLDDSDLNPLNWWQPDLQVAQPST